MRRQSNHQDIYLSLSFFSLSDILKHGFLYIWLFLEIFFSRVLSLNVPGLLFLYVNGKPYKNNKHTILQEARECVQIFFNIKQAGLRQLILALRQRQSYLCEFTLTLPQSTKGF